MTLIQALCVIGLVLDAIFFMLLMLDLIINGPRRSEEQRRVTELVSGLKVKRNPWHPSDPRWYDYEDWWEKEGWAIARAHNDRLSREHRRWVDGEKRKSFAERLGNWRVIIDELR